MFKQFIDNTIGADIYLITSLGIFLVFFIVVTVMLFTMSKEHIGYMSELPLNDDKEYNYEKFDLHTRDTVCCITGLGCSGTCQRKFR